MFRNVILIIMLVAVSFLLISCGSSRQLGQERIVENSGGDKDWINKRSYEENSRVYFVGEMSGVKNRSFGLDQAQANGMRQALTTLQNKASQVSGQALQGTNLDDGEIGGYSKFAVSWIADNITTAGITSPQTYWEKIEKTTDMGVNYTYNCYVLLSVSQQNYNKMLNSAFEAAAKKAQSDNNKKAEDFLNDVINRLENTP